MKAPILLMMLFALPLLVLSAQPQEPGKIKVAIVKNYSEGPRTMAEGGLLALLEKLGCEIKSIDTVALSEEEKKQYGDWNRDALESGHIGRLVAKNRRDEVLIIGLLTNCTDLLGMADFNTPETTLSGMLGGMPVAISAGLCLTRLRMKSGLDPALPTKYIVFGCLRDVDPLEQELLDRSQCEFLSVGEIRSLSDVIDNQMKRLSGLADVIYVHVDMDVLDPAEVRGHSLTVPQGPTSKELAAAIQKMFAHPKVAAIGIASLPFGQRDKQGISLKAAYRLIEGAVKGFQER